MVVEDFKTIIKECYNFWESEYKDMRNLMHLNTGLQTLDALTVIHFIDILMDEYESGNNTVPVYTVHDNFITTPLRGGGGASVLRNDWAETELAVMLSHVLVLIVCFLFAI
ncbi:hypothetical protein ACJX0J_005986, partial [Zea mays]